MTITIVTLAALAARARILADIGKAVEAWVIQGGAPALTAGDITTIALEHGVEESVVCEVATDAEVEILLG